MSSSAVATGGLRFHKLWLSIGRALVLLVVYLSLAPLAASIPVAQGDKIGHLLAYGGLMLWFSQLYSEKGTRRNLAMALVALGVAMEIGQYFTPYRTFELADMLANATGVGIGWLIAPPRTANFLRFAETRFR